MDQTDNKNIVDFLHQFYKVTGVMKSFMRQQFKAHDLDITFEMLQVLQFLWNKDGVNQQEIADAILKDKASLTYLIDNLVRRKLVQRTEDSHDRRNKIITLTTPGQEMQNKIEPSIAEMYRLASKDIPEGLLENGLTLFSIIYQNFQEENK